MQMETAMPDSVMEDVWDNAAVAIRVAATTSYLDGGLWHPDNQVFINYMDFKDPALASPHDQNWNQSALQRVRCYLSRPRHRLIAQPHCVAHAGFDLDESRTDAELICSVQDPCRRLSATLSRARRPRCRRSTR